MNPTLKERDILHILPYVNRRIQPGDVIGFTISKDEPLISHRVVSIQPQFVKTKGDNSLTVDAWPVYPKHILGRVEFLQRGKRRIKVFGGRTGRVIAKRIGIIVGVKTKIKSILKPVYLMFSRSVIIKGRLHRLFKIRIFRFKRPNGTELQLFFGKRLIGRLNPGENIWRIKKPFRLFVDETSLPSCGDSSISDPTQNDQNRFDKHIEE